MLILADTAIHTGAFPGIEPRLMVPAAAAGPLDFDAECQLGTYLRKQDLDIIRELEIAGLQGRGGAGFPAATKWSALANNAASHKVVVANGEEGEPASRKDRWLLTHRPHCVLDGLLLAAQAIGATRAIVYLSHEETVHAMRKAIDELMASHLKPALRVEVHVVKATYVAGEETAVCRAINGGPALPTSRPPRPFEVGVDGAPTLVTNVETLAYAAWISRHGGDRFRTQGVTNSPGTTLMTLTGACRRPGVYEVPLGATIDDVFQTVGGGYIGTPRGYIMGGWFGGFLSANHGTRNCCYVGLRKAGTGLGCAAITALSDQDDAVQMAGDIAAWYSAESAHQCGVCTKGTQSIAATIGRISQGQGVSQDRENLIRWGTTLRGRGACAFLDGAATLARSLIHEFDDAVSERLAPQVPETPTTPVLESLAIRKPL
ncbi:MULTISPECIES: NADH-ubiquinone oxidoreductase-F iron-sulfur binding region domain-containing protein [Burkholderia]|uniref:NADH dehydrogenase subunit F n=1 Tax=Burkholderia paludis TaxID=1506587 RepID=A0A6P2L9U6_9BURK|nr:MULTISPECIES: NADH-ubiquinone oxidoreductase-F iron-sulfur binding region domain-containing protein [Burkholderia]CAB3772675.1 NADH-quinone oxidoreductase subunit 1 [Burkholderia paludis]VWB63822.1 NADH dehydrogenase subunit F [Burkholderia paludis]